MVSGARPEMWSRLDDELLDHPKISLAARELGLKNGRVIVLGFYVMALMWTNRHLTDGVLSDAVIDGFSHYVIKPASIADALAHAGLFDRQEAGYRIHDFRDYNPSAVEIKRRRREDRDRKAAERAAERKGNGRA
jgi:hypothetical protein